MKKELLSPEELEMVKGGLASEVRSYPQGYMGTINCCNVTPPPPPPVEPV